jgi:hypothetical protein
MTEPLSNKSPVGPPLERGGSKGSLVVPHQPIDDAIVALFDRVMDAELEKFERRFRHWIISPRVLTPQRP